MQITIELPERLVDTLETRARELHSSLQQLAIQAIERDLAWVGNEAGGQRRVALPLVRSKEPGSLRSMTNAEIDSLLGN